MCFGSVGAGHRHCDCCAVCVDARARMGGRRAFGVASGRSRLGRGDCRRCCMIEQAFLPLFHIRPRYRLDSQDIPSKMKCHYPRQSRTIFLENKVIPFQIRIYSAARARLVCGLGAAVWAVRRSPGFVFNACSTSLKYNRLALYLSELRPLQVAHDDLTCGGLLS